MHKAGYEASDICFLVHVGLEMQGGMILIVQ